MRLTFLWLAAAAISGFTLRRYLGPLDEGILLQAATRMADGQWPWRDFGWSYGPGQPLFVLKGHTDAVNGASFSPDSQRILTSTHDHIVTYIALENRAARPQAYGVEHVNRATLAS